MPAIEPISARHSGELITHGWRLTEQYLLRARAEDELVIHWFHTPEDSSVHADLHWFDNDRVAKFLRVVVPTLADQLKASMLAVALPWDVTDETATLSLVTIVTGHPAAITARNLTRTALADAAPYWRLGAAAEPPAELAQITARLAV